jgi:hypothetical protein
MSSIDEPFLITQMIFFFVSAIFLFILAYSVYVSNNQIMNKVFSFSFLSLGLNQFVFGIRNLYLLVFKEPMNLFSARLSFTFLPLALFGFFITILLIRFGEEMLKKELIITSLLWLLTNLIVIWFSDSITLSEDSIGNLQTSILFKIVVFGSTIILYIISYYFVLWSYFKSDENLTWFLYGFTLCGLSLLSFGLSDFFRILDLISPIILSISMIVLFRGFTRYESYTISAFDEFSPIPCLLIITSKGGLTIYTKEFINENFPTNLIGGYLTSFNMISSELFDETGPISLIKYKKYNLIMQSRDELTFAFLFKGSSKIISQKFGVFIDELKINHDIWQELHKKVPKLTENYTHRIESHLTDQFNK